MRSLRLGRAKGDARLARRVNHGFRSARKRWRAGLIVRAEETCQLLAEPSDPPHGRLRGDGGILEGLGDLRIVVLLAASSIASAARSEDASAAPATSGRPCSCSSGMCLPIDRNRGEGFGAGTPLGGS